MTGPATVEVIQLYHFFQNSDSLQKKTNQIIIKTLWIASLFSPEYQDQ